MPTDVFLLFLFYVILCVCLCELSVDFLVTGDWSDEEVTGEMSVMVKHGSSKTSFVLL